ncbi:MAG: fused MFS/spermidine synthase [Sandaracinaceae bacterium]|nr:fused MFS/spermidine synthase [Sandaracinaceae bacterium]
MNVSAAARRLALLSGFAGLLYEVLWVRIFTGLLGSTTESVSAVVSAFMFGAALGAATLGKRADQASSPMKFYARLELAAAATAAVAFALFFWLNIADGGFLRELPYTVLRWFSFAVAVMFVALPAALMAGTLPALVRIAAEGGEDSVSAIPRIYAVHTLGAAAGALASPLIVANVGYSYAYGVAVGVSCVAALLALVVAARSAPATQPASVLTVNTEEAESPALKSWYILVAVGGFVALGYEVIWFRLANLLLRGTIVSFGLTLAVYLVGLSLGSAWVGMRESDQRADRRKLFFVQFVVALLLIGGAPAMAWLCELATERGPRVGGTLLLLLITTLAIGAVLPLYARVLVPTGDRVGKALGRVYAANVSGAVLGSLVTGFVLVPWLGTATSLFALAAVSALTAAFTASKALRSRAFVAFAIVTGLAVFVSVRGKFVERLVNSINGHGLTHVVAIDESELQLLSVLEDSGNRRELWGGPFVSGSTDFARRQTQRFQAHLGMLAHPHPRRVLEVGYGVGEILRTILLYRPEHVDLVEIDPHMIDVADEHFEALSHGSAHAPNVTIHQMDGRHYLRRSHESWDVIMSDSMILESEGSLRLYTVEHFEAGRERLAPGGIMMVWLPLNIGEEESRIILASFASVFPQSLVFLPEMAQRSEAYLVGFRDHASIDWPTMHQRFDTYARDDLALFGWHDPIYFLGSLRATPSDLASLVPRGTPLNRDARPVLDFVRDETFGEFTHHLLTAQPSGVFDWVHLEEGETATRTALDSLRRADRAYHAGCDPLGDDIRRVEHVRVPDERACTNAISHFPDYANAKLALAELYVARASRAQGGQERRALLQRALRENPYNARANVMLIQDADVPHAPDVEAARRRLSVLIPYSSLARH